MPEKNNLRILVVEDEPSLLDLYSMILTDAEYEVMTAEDGQQALEIIKDNTFDLVLLDIMLPNVDGLAVLDKLSEDEGYQHQALNKVVMMTNINQDQVISQAIARGVRGYLVKSDYDPAQFIEAVKEILGA